MINLRDMTEAECRAHGKQSRALLARSEFAGWLAKAEGWYAIKFYVPPEDQGDTLVQVRRPHDPRRLAWIAGWDSAELEGTT